MLLLQLNMLHILMENQEYWLWGRKEAFNKTYKQALYKRIKHLKQKVTKIDATKQHEWPPERSPPLALSLFDRSQSRLFA